MGKDVIIACDFPDRERVLGFLDQFRDERPYVKIGMELFYAAGPDIVREIKARGHSVFLDLKLCDIPNTVNHAMRVLRDLGADMINLHAFGTQKMMAAAVDGLTRPDGTRPLLVRRRGRPGAHHDARRGAHARLGLHRRRPPDHGRGRPRRGLPPLRF